MTTDPLYPVSAPKITGAVFSVNPVSINTETVLTVTITEETLYLEPYYYYSADLYSGEV